MILVPARTQSWVLWSHISPSIVSWVSHPVECNFHFYWIKLIRLYSKDEENATSPTKQFPLYLKGLSFSLLWGREKERVRECVCSALYLDFYLNLGIPDLLFLSFSCNSSLIFFKSNKPPSQTLTKESQPWRSPRLGIEASLILVAGEPLWAVDSGQRFIVALLSGANSRWPLSPASLGGWGSLRWWQLHHHFLMRQLFRYK